MDILSLSPMQVGAIYWMPRQGSHAMTVVCKGTFDLCQGPSRLSEVQDFPNDEDNHWNDDSSCSVYAPSDMAPFKRRADVVLVGDAYAPSGDPVRSLVARVIVGSVDKAIEVTQNRYFDRNGELQLEEPFSRMALRYERAGGGPHSNNPVGRSPEGDRDAYGRLLLPNLQRVGTAVASPSEYIDPIGFGPIAASWDSRRKLLGRHAPTWSSRRWNSLPLPQDIDGGYFSCAPLDQRFDKLTDTERIVLEHLHPQHPRLVCHLPGIRPRAFVERGGAARGLDMRPDTLWIDTTRLVFTVTWRAHLEVEGVRERGRIVVGLEEGNKRLTWADIRKLENGGSIQDEGTNDVVDLPIEELPFKRRAIDDEHTAVGSLNIPHEALPDFLKAETRPRRRRSAQSMPAIKAAANSPAALPLVSEHDRSPSWLGAQSKVPGPTARTSSPPPSMDAAHEGYPAAPVPASPWAKGESVAPPAGPAGVSAVPLPAPPMMPAAPMVTPAVQPPLPGPQLPAIRAPNPAEALNKGIATTLESERPAAPIDRLARPAAQQIVELLWFQETLIESILERQSWKDLLDELHRDDDKFDPIDFDDEPPPEEPEEVRHRRDIVAIMTRGRITASASLNHTMLDAVDDSGSFEPPFVLMSGRLHLPFDELETLKATLAAVTPLIAGNKELAETVATVQELMTTPWLQEGSGEVAQKLTDKIRAVFKKGDRVLDPAYLDDHTERILLEQRRYQHRTVLGDEWIRGLLAPSSSKERIPTYIPLAIAKDLPMFKSFDARVIGEAHVQQDQYEQHLASVKVCAVGRVVNLTKTAGIY
jgi:hypothetical protein